MTPSASAGSAGPNFLGIGAPRCGTTWLHKMLEQHPDVWLPPIKEVHYFDSLDPTLRGRWRIDLLGDRVRKHLISRVAHYAAAMAGPVAPSIRYRARPEWAWDRRFFAGGGSAEWYCSLFEGKRAAFSRVGEITPAYFALSDDVIAGICASTQVDRLILMLRDPIDSAWSGYGRRIRDGQVKGGGAGQAAVVRNLLQEGLTRRLYASNLRRWLAHFSRDRIFIGYFEELSEDPAGLFDRICDFLHIDRRSSMLGNQVGEKVNSSRDSRSDIAPEIERILAEQFEPDLRQLAALLGGRAEGWHQRTMATLRR
jgi:hypothetical protein